MFNEERDIEATVSSVLAQKCPNFEMEVVLIDDGSNDGTYKLCCDCYDTNPIVQILHSKKKIGG